MDTTAPAPTTTAADIQLGSDGRLSGIDGVLDQILSSIVRNARPLITDDILPVLQRDKELQREIGAAAGNAAAARIAPALWLIGGALALGAIALAYQAWGK